MCVTGGLKWLLWCCVCCGMMPSLAAQSPQWVLPEIPGPLVQRVLFDSAAAGEQVSCYVSLPPEYDSQPQRRFPVLYWLHGMGGGSAGVTQVAQRYRTAMQTGQLPPLIIVFPNGLSAGMWCDWKFRDVRLETILIEELIPHIDGVFRTVRGPEGRIIEGFSTGGYGAARLGLRHHQLFGAVSMLGAGPLQLDSGDAARLVPEGGEQVLLDVYGGDQQYFEAQSPWRIAEMEAGSLREGRVVRQIVGDRDETLKHNQNFHRHLDSLQIPHEFRQLPAVSQNLNAVLNSLGEDNWKFYRRALTGLVPPTLTVEPSQRPNILVIFSDDHGWADLGVQGVDPDVRTPHLDQLARDGVRFERGYVTAPQCVPSRAALLTGRYQQRFGVEDNNRGPLPLSELTIAERLRPQDYVSGWVGKSHLDIGAAKGVEKSQRILADHMPQHQGFDEYFRGEQRQYYASHDLLGRPLPNAPQVITDNRFRVVVQTEAALSFLDRRAADPERPWFLYLAMYAPHVPLESPEPWFSETPEHLPLQRRQALAMIAAMDEGVGRIREKLREQGADRRTLIFFIGDNGAPLGTAWDGSLNKPLAGQKGMLSEGGVRTPFVAAWPGRWPAGGVYSQPVSSLDVAATAAAAAGLRPDPQLDGVDLTPYVTGQRRDAPHERLFWRWGSQSAVLEMPWKLIRLGNRPPLLFDVSTPEGEHQRRNLVTEQPEVAARLDRRLREWAAQLQPAGLSEDASAFSRRHEELFGEHELIAGERGAMPSAVPPREDEVAIQGWIGRNGVLTKTESGLLLEPESEAAGARAFLTNSRLDIPGPVTVVLRIRAVAGGTGPGRITWRTREASFAEHQVSEFRWPEGAEWREVAVELRERSRIQHVRIQPPVGAEGVEVQAMEFRGAGEVVEYWFGG
ncbi:MAG: sulfatase-like hydrolase/transferase [Planctomyces sp.]|nr:sulfatase-like hydrolase/transferase [Planctomyces sp.]